MTTAGSTPGSGDPGNDTGTDWPAAPPPPGAPPALVQPTLPPAAAPQPPGSPQTPWAPPSQGAPGAGPGWAPPPAGGGRLAVPGAPGLEFASGLARFVAYVIDVILITFASVILSAILGGFLPGTAAVAVQVAFGIAVDAAYFIGLWTTEGHATLGMRLLKLQVGNAFDGRKLELGQAARRWVALGSWLGALGVSSILAGLGGLVWLVWGIVLLISTVSSPTKQGLHDKFANSAVVVPAGASMSGLALGCILIFVVVAGLLVFSFVALIFLGGQVSSILSAVGESI